MGRSGIVLVEFVGKGDALFFVEDANPYGVGRVAIATATHKA